MRTFAVVNQKGGCGKTTTAINLSAVFARRGLRTLLVDMDPQSHCAIGLGVPEKSIDRDLGEALLRAGSDRFDPDEFVWEVARNLDLIPSTIRLAALEAPGGGLHQLADRDRRLARLLERYAGRYDRCLVDCPPTIGLLTFNALRAVREALIPVETGFFALRGADRQWRTIRQLVERIGRPIACHLVPTLHREASLLSGEILNELRQQFAGQVLPVVIHEEEVVREATSFGQPVIEYAPQSRSARDFDELADWLEDHAPPPLVQIEVAAAGRSPAELGSQAAQSTSAEQGTPRLVQGRAAELVRLVKEMQMRSAAGHPQMTPGTKHQIPQATTQPVTSETVAHQSVSPETVAPQSVFEAGIEAEVIGPGTTEGEAQRFGAHPTPQGVRFTQPGDRSHLFFVAGEFNRWSATATPLRYDVGLGAHEALVQIPPGRYQYRLVINGTWLADPYNQQKRLNEYGEPNSLLVVPSSPDVP